MGPQIARRATRFELSSSVVGPLQRLAAGQRTQRRTSATADNAYEAMMQAYVRTARELREASRAQEALNARRSTRLRRCWPTATASTSSSTTSSPTP